MLTKSNNKMLRNFEHNIKTLNQKKSDVVNLLEKNIIYPPIIKRAKTYQTTKDFEKKHQDKNNKENQILKTLNHIKYEKIDAKNNDLIKKLKKNTAKAKQNIILTDLIKKKPKRVNVVRKMFWKKKGSPKNSESNSVYKELSKQKSLPLIRKKSFGKDVIMNGDPSEKKKKNIYSTHRQQKQDKLETNTKKFLKNIQKYLETKNRKICKKIKYNGNSFVIKNVYKSQSPSKISIKTKPNFSHRQKNYEFQHVIFSKIYLYINSQFIKNQNDTKKNFLKNNNFSRKKYKFTKNQTKWIYKKDKSICFKKPKIINPEKTIYLNLYDTETKNADLLEVRQNILNNKSSHIKSKKNKLQKNSETHMITDNFLKEKKCNILQRELTENSSEEKPFIPKLNLNYIGNFYSKKSKKSSEKIPIKQNPPYKIIKCIGKGSYASVYLGKKNNLIIFSQS